MIIPIIDPNLNVIRNGLVLWLDVGIQTSYPDTGTTWFDLSGNGNDGTLVNGVTYNSGSGGNLIFDGTNDYVNCGNDSSLSLSTFTASSWIFPKDLSSRNNIISKENNADWIYAVGIVPNKISFYINNGSWVGQNSASTIPLDTWVHILVSYDGSTKKIYINGLLDSTQSAAGMVLNASTPTVIGINASDLTSFPLDANIGQVSIYNRVLSATEVLHNYRTQKTRFGLPLSPVLQSMQNVSGDQEFYRYNVDTNTFNLISNPTFTITSGAGPVTAATSKNNPNFLVSCVNHASTGQPVVIYSTNGGVSWSSLTYGRYWFGSCVSEDGNFAIAFLSGTDRKHYYTTNGGSSWTLGSGPFLTSGFNRLPWCNYDGSLIIIPTTVSTIYFWHNNRGTLVSKSTPTNHMSAFAPANAVYGGSFRVWYGPNTSSTGIYYSDDWGDSWTLKVIDAGFSATWTNVAGSSDGVNMYAARDNGTNTKLYHSSDSGDTWTEITPAGSTRFNVYHPFICDWSGRFLYIGEGNSTTIHYSDDFGQNWTTLTSPVSGASFNRTINFVNSI